MQLTARKKDAIVVAVYTYGGLLFSFIFSSLFIRYDGGEMYGIYAHSLALLGFIVVALGFGFQVSLVKINISNDGYRSVATGSLLLWTLVVLVGSLFYYIVYYNFTFNMTFLLVMVAAAATLTELVGCIWQWHQRIVAFKEWLVLRSLLNIVLVLLLINNYFSTGVFLILLCVIAVLHLFYLIHKSGAITWFGKEVWNRNLYRDLKTKLWGQSKFFWASLLAVAVYGKISVLMLGYFDYSNQEIGRFAYLYTIMAAFLVLPASIQTYLMRPLFAREMNGSSVFRRTLPIYIIIGAVCSLLFWKVLPLIIEIMIGKSEDLVEVLWAFAPSILIVYVASLLGMGLMTDGKERERAVVQWVSAIAHVSLNVILIPLYSLKGAALATTGSYFLLLCGFIYVALKDNVWNVKKYAITLLMISGCSLGFFLFEYVIIIPAAIGLVLLGKIYFVRQRTESSSGLPLTNVKKFPN